MGLSIKSFGQILTGMVDWITTNTSKLTDFSVGSATLTLLEGVASAIEEAYYDMYKNVQWAIQNALFQSFGFDQESAVAASGTVTINFTNALPTSLYLPEGTMFATSNSGLAQTLYFVTQQAYTIAQGSVTADVTVYCTTLGTIGNVAAGTITVITSPMSSIQSVTNNVAFTSGKEAETLPERQARFNQYIQTLSKGTIKALEYGCLEVSGIAGAVVDDTKLGVVYVYCHDSNGNLSSDLQTQVQNNLENYRAAGIPVIVQAIVKNLIDVAITVTVDPMYNTMDYKMNIKTLLTNYINNLTVSESLYLADIYQFVMNIDPINISNVSIQNPMADVISTTKQIIRVNSLDVTLQNATSAPSSPPMNM